MLSDAKIIDIADYFKSQYMHGGIMFDEFDSSRFARAIECEATAPLIEQIKEDEALMRDVFDAHENGVGMISAINALRQRLEAKKES